MQLLKGLRELGHPVTFIARDGKNLERHEAPLCEMGISVYAGDGERLRALGKDAGNAGWSLDALLWGNTFAFAVLIQNFRCGISIPEHYLDAIRRGSPQTRVAILSDEMYGKAAARRAEITQQIEHHEVAEDWSAREREAFQRADLAIIRSAYDAVHIEQYAPALPTGIIPVSYSCQISARGWKERSGILLAMDIARSGDVDGLVWFLEKAWASISRKSGDIELLVAGGDAVPLESRQKLPRVKWFAAQEKEQLAASVRIFVAPQRFGRVMSGIAHMVSSGLPGVATSFAAESAGLNKGVGVLAADTPEDFVVDVLRIYQEEKTWNRVSSSGLTFASVEFTWDAFKLNLKKVWGQTAKFTSKPAAGAPFSMTLVDSLYAGPLSAAPVHRRIALRLDGHVQLAWELIRSGKPSEAREQLRHVFSWLGESVQFSAPLARLLSVLAHCYRELGDAATVARCAQEARRCFAAQLPAATVSTKKSAPKRDRGPKISVIVPSFNRLPILRKCLAALEAQTFSAKKFEVIVIDDGSSDGTEEAMRQYRPPYRFQYLRQNNSGTGAARRNGVAHASGEYLLLMNDDTICDPDLIEQHMRVHQNLASERWAVLGNFEYPVEARQRALTHFLRTDSFMFPQVDMEDGFPYPYSHFITCNLSIRREAVVEAGSFDSTYKLSEDTELGIRLFEQGFGVLYHPAAHAWHDHLPYVTANLIRRARIYGADYFHMFRRHPRVMREWAMPVNITGMDQATARTIFDYLERNRREVEAAIAALMRWDAVEFEAVLAKPEEASQVLCLLKQAVPAIHWFYLFESMLETMNRKLQLALPRSAGQAVMQAAQSAR
jgi:GT2 family glycosyltransferase